MTNIPTISLTNPSKSTSKTPSISPIKNPTTQTNNATKIPSYNLRTSPSINTLHPINTPSLSASYNPISPSANHTKSPPIILHLIHPLHLQNVHHNDTITDHFLNNTAQIIIGFSNNSKLSLPTKYCVQIAIISDEFIKNNNYNEEKKGEIDNDIKIEWKEIVTDCLIHLNAIDKTKYLIKNLKYNTKYLIRCKCCNKYGWSKFCKYISFITKDKIFGMDSNILNKNEKQIFYKNILIEKLNKNKNEINIQLLFRGSRDGFGADKFHLKCDGKKKTIVIIESNLGNVFGGYTKIGWSSDNQWHYDGNCFLFLCRDLNRNNNNNNKNKNNKFEIYPIKQSCYSKAVKHYSSHGPCFGKGHDLLIVNAANITDSRSDGESFVNLKGNVLTGSVTQIHNKYWHFVVRDYEVFQIL